MVIRNACLPDQETKYILFYVKNASYRTLSISTARELTQIISTFLPALGAVSKLTYLSSAVFTLHVGSDHRFCHLRRK